MFGAFWGVLLVLGFWRFLGLGIWPFCVCGGCFGLSASVANSRKAEYQQLLDRAKDPTRWEMGVDIVGILLRKRFPHTARWLCRDITFRREDGIGGGGVVGLGSYKV